MRGGAGRHIRTAIVLLLLLCAVGYAGWYGWQLVSTPVGEDVVTAEPSCTPAQTLTRAQRRQLREQRELAERAARLPQPSTISLEVLNATFVPGLAADTAAVLEDEGFLISGVGNEPRGEASRQVAVIRAAPNQLRQARQVALYFPGARVQQVLGTEGQVTVVLGDRFSEIRVPPTLDEVRGPGEDDIPNC
jgi:hypothetical protein